MSSPKKYRHVKGLCARCLSVLWPRTPYPPPPPRTHCILYLFTHGRCGGKGGDLNQRGYRGSKVHKAGIHDWLYLQSINSNKHLPLSPLTGNFFRWRHFALVSSVYTKLISPWLSVQQMVTEFIFQSSPQLSSLSSLSRRSSRKPKNRQTPIPSTPNLKTRWAVRK